MTLIRWQQPKSFIEPDFANIQRHFERFFGELDGGRQAGAESGAFIPRVDVSEDDKNVYLHAELPGLTAEDVKVTVTEGVLSIRGEKNRSEKHTGKNFI